MTLIILVYVTFVYVLWVHEEVYVQFDLHVKCGFRGPTRTDMQCAPLRSL